MQTSQKKSAIKLTNHPKYLQLLGKTQAIKLLELFEEINNGKYNKEELHLIQLKTIKHPFYIRAIRADMQSFINTFIEPYLEPKAYLSNTTYVIDAGANIGYTAILFATWWSQATIISIEPDQENYELVLKNTAPYPNIKVLHNGLWNKETLLRIEAGQEDGFVVREIKNKNTSVSTENSSIGISLQKIMKTFKMPHLDFLKLNIEGSEKNVFEKNYQTWLPKTKTLLIELHDGKNTGCSKTVFSTINQYDFAVAETASYGILFTNASVYSNWYAKWYKEEIYTPNINKTRFPKFYLDGK